MEQKKGNFSRNKKIAYENSIIAFYDLSPISDYYVVHFEWDKVKNTYLIKSSQYVVTDFEETQENFPQVIFHPFRLTHLLMRQIILFDTEQDEDYSEDIFEDSIDRCIGLIQSPDIDKYLKKWMKQFPKLSPYIKKRFKFPKRIDPTQSFFKYLREYLANEDNYTERVKHYVSFRYTIKIRHFIDFMMDKMNIVVEKQFADIFLNTVHKDPRFDVVAKRIGLPYYKDGFYFDPEKRIYVIETTF